MSCCCATKIDVQQLSVHDCFERGLATRRLPELTSGGQRIAGANSLWACFSLHTDDCGCLTDIRFDASTCTTLIAYCQALVDINRGQSLGHALRYGSRDLATAVSGVPAAKYDRAILAIAALRAAIIASPADSQWEKPNESRLHLRDPETHRVLRARAHDSAAA